MKLINKLLGKKFKLDFTTISIITTVIGLVLFIINFYLFSSDPNLFTSINILIAIEMIGFPLIFRYSKFQKIKNVEASFPLFLLDITDNINTGMTLPQAIRASKTNDYGDLTPHVKEINAKMSWGISFERSLREFAKTINSDSLRRTIETIIEAHKSGGTMNTVLEAVADSLQQIEKIKKERSASVYSQMINGYMIYVIFLGVMIGISSFLVPTFDTAGTSGAELQNTFPAMFRALSVIQGFFAGLAIGKMSEGTLSAGIKHSMVLSILGYSVFTLLA